jgi:hypothetical protein
MPISGNKFVDDVLQSYTQFRNKVHQTQHKEQDLTPFFIREMFSNEIFEWGMNSYVQRIDTTTLTFIFQYDEDDFV